MATSTTFNSSVRNSILASFKEEDFFFEETVIEDTSYDYFAELFETKTSSVGSFSYPKSKHGTVQKIANKWKTLLGQQTMWFWLDNDNVCHSCGEFFTAYPYKKVELVNLKLEKEMIKAYPFFKQQKEAALLMGDYVGAMAVNLLSKEEIEELYKMDDFRNILSELQEKLRLERLALIKKGLNGKGNYSYVKNTSIPWQYRANRLAEVYDYSFLSCNFVGMEESLSQEERLSCLGAQFDWFSSHVTMDNFEEEGEKFLGKEGYNFPGIVDGAPGEMAFFLCYLYEQVKGKNTRVFDRNLHGGDVLLGVEFTTKTVDALLSGESFSFSEFYNVKAPDEVRAFFNKNYENDVYHHNVKDLDVGFREQETLSWASCPNWCTSKGGYQNSEFKVLFKDGKPHIGIRYDSSRIVEVQGPQNSGNLSPEQVGFVRSNYAAFSEAEMFQLEDKMSSSIEKQVVASRSLPEIVEVLSTFKLSEGFIFCEDKCEGRFASYTPKITISHFFHFG